jgi:hypothetical protein
MLVIGSLEQRTSGELPIVTPVIQAGRDKGEQRDALLHLDGTNYARISGSRILATFETWQAELWRPAPLLARVA